MLSEKRLTKDELINKLNLTQHFEGGYFRETFRSGHKERVETVRGTRSAMTAIYYMLTADSPIDVFHTKQSDGIQFHHNGEPIIYHLIHPDGRYERVVLGQDVSDGQQLQLAVKGGTWKAAELASGEFGLVSEVVAPGWELEDMVLASRAELQKLFPQHEKLLERLARE